MSNWIVSSAAIALVAMCGAAAAEPPINQRMDLIDDYNARTEARPMLHLCDGEACEVVPLPAAVPLIGCALAYETALRWLKGNPGVAAGRTLRAVTCETGTVG